MDQPGEWERATAPRTSAVRERPFQFFSPSRGFWSRDGGVAVSNSTDLVEDVKRAITMRERNGRAAVVAGALPFDRAHAPRLQVHTPSRDAPRVGKPKEEPRTSCSTLQQPTPEGYLAAVATAVTRIQSGALRKVVLARALDLDLGRALDADVLLDRLRKQNPGKYVFSCDVSRPGAERRVMIGASPELLLSKRGAEVVSHPLAGSVPRSPDVAEDGTRAARLLESMKDLREHAFVVEAVGDTLAPYCRELNVPRLPSLVQTPTMWHLGSRVTGVLRDPSLSSLQLAIALHPTPAVCGEPRARAAAAIAELEGFDRGFFAGAVGYTDGAGDGEWAVTIRCAELSEQGVRLYAGAGIVADSRPEDELTETSAKLRTMLRALGLEQLEHV